MADPQPVPPFDTPDRRARRSVRMLAAVGVAILATGCAIAVAGVIYDVSGWTSVGGVAVAALGALTLLTARRRRRDRRRN